MGHSRIMYGSDRSVSQRPTISVFQVGYGDVVSRWLNRSSDYRHTYILHQDDPGAIGAHHLLGATKGERQTRTDECQYQEADIGAVGHAAVASDVKVLAEGDLAAEI